MAVRNTIAYVAFFLLWVGGIAVVAAFVGRQAVASDLWFVVTGALTLVIVEFAMYLTEKEDRSKPRVRVALAAFFVLAVWGVRELMFLAFGFPGGEHDAMKNLSLSFLMGLIFAYTMIPMVRYMDKRTKRKRQS